MLAVTESLWHLSVHLSTVIRRIIKSNIPEYPIPDLWCWSNIVYGIYCMSYSWLMMLAVTESLWHLSVHLSTVIRRIIKSNIPEGPIPDLWCWSDIFYGIYCMSYSWLMMLAVTENFMASVCPSVNCYQEKYLTVAMRPERVANGPVILTRHINRPLYPMRNLIEYRLLSW